MLEELLGEAKTKEKAIHESGLVSVLRQIHDDLDAAVFDAYGWPHDLADEQILERLVALNRERAGEEQRGLVRWLRPDFQSKGKAPKPTQAEMLTLPTRRPAAGEPLPWPKTLPERIAAVRATLRASRGQDLPTIAATFKRAPRKDIDLALDSLAALGLAVAYDTKDGRQWRLTARRAA
ncbi:MAG: RNA-binding protein [Deltaproteobacteria bacterium]